MSSHLFTHFHHFLHLNGENSKTIIKAHKSCNLAPEKWTKMVTPVRSFPSLSEPALRVTPPLVPLSRLRAHKQETSTCLSLAYRQLVFSLSPACSLPSRKARCHRTFDKLGYEFSRALLTSRLRFTVCRRRSAVSGLSSALCHRRSTVIDVPRRRCYYCACSHSIPSQPKGWSQ